MASSTIPYGKQQITEDDIQAVVASLQSDFLTQGPMVNEFEEAFARYVGARYAVAVANGTAALHLSTMALNVKPGQRVITSPITFAASANCVLYCGGDVDFADIDPKTYCLDLNRVEDLLKKNPKKYSGIIPVDYAGHPIQADAFRALADRYGLWIIEDACHAPGASFLDAQKTVQRSGNGKYSELSIFSFHPVKHIASGEGGMITTNDQKLYQRMQKLRTHGITKDPAQMARNDGGWFMEMQELGYNYRIPDMLCALGNSQLKRAEANFKRRQEIAKRYDHELKDLPVVLPYTAPDSVHAFHLYVIQTAQRRELYDFLKTKNIYAQVHYIPVHQHPYYVERYGKQQFELSDAFYNQCLSIPMYHSMSDEEQTRVVGSLKEFFAR